MRCLLLQEPRLLCGLVSVEIFLLHHFRRLPPLPRPLSPGPFRHNNAGPWTLTLPILLLGRPPSGMEWDGGECFYFVFLGKHGPAHTLIWLLLPPGFLLYIPYPHIFQLQESVIF